METSSTTSSKSLPERIRGPNSLPVDVVATNPNGDFDQDGVKNADEVSLVLLYQTNPYLADTDGDGPSTARRSTAYRPATRTLRLRSRLRARRDGCSAPVWREPVGPFSRSSSALRRASRRRSVSPRRGDIRSAPRPVERAHGDPSGGFQPQPSFGVTSMATV